MTNKEIVSNLEAIYLDYYDGLYDEHQLKVMVKKLMLQNAHIPIEEWSELILDAQWKNASERDYAAKRFQIAFENQE
ncbi:hypothetical protein ACFCP7_24660 [Paenibacillus elgii]